LTQQARGGANPETSLSGIQRIVKTLVPPLLIALLFSLALSTSFTAALHSPSFHGVKVAVAGPHAQELAAGINQEPKLGLNASVVPTRAAVEDRIEHRDIYGGFVLAPQGNEVLVAAAANADIAKALPQIFKGIVAAEEKRAGAPDAAGAPTAKVVDLAPLPTEDSTGAVGYFVMIGLAIGAYFAGLMLNSFVRLRLVGIRLALARILTLFCYSIIASLVMLLVVDTIAGFLNGPFVEMWLFLSLLTFAVSVLANALIHFFGLVGTAAVIILITILGNPSAGGSVAWPLLPGFFGTIGPLTPNGAATEGLRNIVYFNANSLGSPLLVLCVYAVVGIALTLAAAGLRKVRYASRDEAEAGAASAGAGGAPLTP